MRRFLLAPLTIALVVASMLVVPGRAGGQAATPATDAVLDAKKALVRRNFEIANTGDFDRLTEVLAPDFVIRTAPLREEPGVTELIGILTASRTGLLDLTFRIDDMIAEGTPVVVPTTIRGTHRGDYLDVPPTGKTIENRAIELWHVADGKLVENWHVDDIPAVMRQVGTIPGGAAGTPSPAEGTAATAAATTTIAANKALARRFRPESFAPTWKDRP